MKRPSRTIGLQVSMKLYRLIEAEAIKSGGTISEVVRLALVRHLLPEKKSAAAA